MRPELEVRLSGISPFLRRKELSSSLSNSAVRVNVLVHRSAPQYVRSSGSKLLMDSQCRD